MAAARRLDVVTLGETMVLLLAEQAGPMREATSFRRHIAGAESNLAVGLCRLEQTSGWISRLGDDEFGHAVLFRIRGEGVDVSTVQMDPRAPTGMVVRERRELGPIEQVYYRRGSAASYLSPADLDADYIGASTYLHLTGITPALSPTCREAVFSAAEIARAAGVKVVLDPNYRSKLWEPDDARKVIRDLAAHADILLPGKEEAELLSGESEPRAAALHLKKLGPQLVVVKLGADGALAITDDRQVIHSPGMHLERVVDPVGAGDAFAAGLLSGLLKGWSTEDALHLANRCGALSMTSPGDMESLPMWADVASQPTSQVDVRR
jgi:2-dehydro-3-deoxygluconokinase